MWKKSFKTRKLESSWFTSCFFLLLPNLCSSANYTTSIGCLAESPPNDLDSPGHGTNQGRCRGTQDDTGRQRCLCVVDELMDQLEGPFFFLLTDFFFVKKLEIRVEEAQLYINDLIKN